MSVNKLAFQFGVMYGFAMGLAVARNTEHKEKRIILMPEDHAISGYIKNKAKVYTEDIIGYMGWDNDRSAATAVGFAMKRLGWDRKRGTGEDTRWYYQRGVRALAYGEQLDRAER